jgi:BirA family biotin operon repressor/biotin-[acetyl-CoA-carboxylase] ligase
LANYKLFSFDKINSTQTYAHDLIAKGTATDRTIVLAAAQSSGRGRYRRTWVSHHGNLYASFIYRSPERNPTLSYAVAVAVAETLLHFNIKPAIKWPNDLLVDGKKIAGILIEYARNFIIIGIGLNVKTNPTVKKNYGTTKTDAHKPGLEIKDILAVLMVQMDHWMGKDFRIVRARWMALAAQLNTPILYGGKPAVLYGINDDGALVLRRGTEYILTFGDEISI